MRSLGLNEKGAKDLDAIAVQSIDPSWRRDADELVREVDERIDELEIFATIPFAGHGSRPDAFMMMVAAFVVMT